MPGSRALVALAVLSLASLPARAHFSDRHHGLGISIESGERVTSCDQLRVRSDREIARSEERLTLAGNTARIKAAQNGGIFVYGTDRKDLAVLTCKVAMSDEETTAERMLQMIKTSSEAGQLTVQGPEDGDWTAYLIIQAPRDSHLSLSGLNGPISVADLSGRIEVQNTNGPLSIKNSPGEINAEITNGPISYAGGGGDVRLRAENGPIDVKLAGTSWNGKGLDAESTNGPLALKIPTDYLSGVLVQTRGYSPFHCSGCDTARKDFDDTNKSVQFGTGPTVVRLSTVNGPVSINENDME
ncbi:MAG TPA: hypothetical protein VG498_25115 [Terriglobales bacterium]|nr:hypothetical protein [Terriglobales bacterium]